MECNCNNNNNGGVIPWVRGNRLPLIICVYEDVVTQEQVGDSTLTVNEMTRVPYEIQADDTVTVTFKSGFRQVEMPFTTEGNKVLVTDNGELAAGTYTVEVTIVRGDGARGRWQETRQVRVYENTSDAQLGEMYAIEADLFFFAKGDTGNGIADITANADDTLTITMTDGTTYTTQAMRGEKGDKGDKGDTGTSIVSFEATGQTDVSVIYTVTFSDDTTQEVAVPKGPQGDTGLTGNGIASTTLNNDYTLTVNYTDGTSYTTPSIRGAQGVQGVSIIAFTQTGETSTNTLYNVVFSDGRTQSVAIPKGVKGDKGDTGNTGSQGAQGPKGDTVTATDYTLYNVQGSSSEGAMSQDATTKAISAQTGYYTCGAAADKVDKVAAVENGNLYKRTLGGHFKVKMTNANTASGVTLQVGSETATTLWYNGAAASADNSWDAGEVLSVYYDGTYYQASNAMGGGSAVGKKQLKGSSGYINLNVEVGQTVTTTVSPSENAVYKEIKVKEGDVFLLTIKKSGTNGRAWGFIDSNRVLLDVAEANITLDNEVIVVPEGVDKVILHASKSSEEPEIIYEWYYAKAGSVGAHEILADGFLYNDMRVLALGETYRENEAVKTEDKQLLRMNVAVKEISLTDVVAAGDLKVSGNNTLKALKNVSAYDETQTYTEGMYAIKDLKVCLYDGSEWSAVTLEDYAEDTSMWETVVDLLPYTRKDTLVDSLTAKCISYDNSIDYFPGDNIQDALGEVGDSTFVEGEAIDLGTKYECMLSSSTKVWIASAIGATRTCRIISVNEGQKYKIYGRTTIREGQSEPDASVYAWLTTDSHVIGERADYVPGYENNLTVPPYIGTIVTAPKGAKYMYVGHNIRNVPRLPRQITPLLSAREGIETLNGSIYGKGYNNGASITISPNDTAYMYSHSGWDYNQSTNCQFIPIENAVSFKITANAEQAVLYAFVTRIREEGDVAGALCPTDRNTHAVLAGETAFTTVIPEDAEYLYIGITDANGRNHTPESIVAYTDKMEASYGNVEDIAEINSQLLVDADDPVYAVDDSLDIAKCLMRHGVVGDQYLRMLYGNDKSHHLLIPTGNASEFTIVGNAVNSTSLVWLSSDEYEYDKTVPLAPGEATKHSIPAGETTVLEVPAGTRFMAVNVDSTENEDARPESITVTGIVSKFTPNKDWKTEKIDDNSSSIKALLGNYDAADGELNLNINELGKDGGIFVQWYYPHVMSTDCIHKRIYYTFCDEKGSTGVGSINAFDHRSWRTVLKRVLTTNNNERKPDMHNTASIQMLPDRRLICFYTEGHSTTPYMLYRITKRPEDITEWEDVVSLRFNCSNVTYCQYHYINGRHYVFTRVDVLKWGYVYSDDLVTWSDLNIFITSDVQYYMLLKPIDGADKKLRFIMYSNPHYNDRAIRSGIIDFETGNVYDYDGVTLKGNISAPISKNDFTKLVPDINTNYTQRMHDLAITDADTIRITYSRAYSRYGNGANKNKYFVYEWNRGDAASGSITDLGEAGEIVVGHSNTYNCSGAFFIDKDRLFVQKSSQDETGDDWTELWTRTNGVWSMTKELYREQKYCFDETDPSNNRIRNFYPNVDSNGKYVLWCRGKYGITDFYNAVSDVMVYDVEKDEIF